MDSLGYRLSEDEWFVLNTLPYILPLLTVPDVLNCSHVCKLWRCIINDSLYWRSLTLRNYKLNLKKMIYFLRDFKTERLALLGCEYVGQCRDNSFKSLIHLKRLELTECTSKLVESLGDDNPNLEYFSASLVSGPSTLKLDLKFVAKLPHLKELHLFCNREVLHLKEMLGHLSQLKRLWMLGISNANFEELHHSTELSSCAQIQSLGLGHCTELSISAILPLIRSFPWLRELCFQYCGTPRWSFLSRNPSENPIKMFKGLSELRNLKRLYLLEFNIRENFEKGLKLMCQNLEELIISSGCNRYHMGKFNGRIFDGVKYLPLKKFTWLFSWTYMTFCKKKFEVEDRVPFVENAVYLNDELGHDEGQLDCFKLKSPSELKLQLQLLMGKCKVRVVSNYNPEDFFWCSGNL